MWILLSIVLSVVLTLALAFRDNIVFLLLLSLLLLLYFLAAVKQTEIEIIEGAGFYGCFHFDLFSWSFWNFPWKICDNYLNYIN